MIRPALRRLVTLEAPVPVSDGGGGATLTWEAVGALWADLQAVSGTEEETGGRLRSKVSHRVIVRAAPPGSPGRPRPDQRFREGARVWGIRAVAEHDPAGRYLVCWAVEGERA